MAGGVVLTAETLAKRLKPDRTVLFLGAGASIPSGGMSGADLAVALSKALAGGEVVSRDLTEASTILENRYGRRALVDEVIRLVKPLAPTGGMLAVPAFNWTSIYTTNFDQIVEKAYARDKRRLIVVRSNYDWESLEEEGTPLFKIHGCVSGDVVLGQKQRLVLTESDLREYDEYRETLFKKLDLDLSTKDVLFIGHSLQDSHVRRDVDAAAALRSEQSLPGKIYVLSYEEDKDRALILQNKGLNVAFGSIDALMDSLAEAGVRDKPSEDERATAPGTFELPLRLRSASIAVAHDSELEPNPRKLFNGSPAKYADIRAGLTIERLVEESLVAKLASREIRVASIIGVGGVGKTTLARRITYNLGLAGYLAFEHHRDFPLRAREWISVEEELRSRDRKAVLLVDDCPAHLTQLNRLLDSLGSRDDPALIVVATAERSQWLPRVKSRTFFGHGEVLILSELPDQDINGFLNLLDRTPSIQEMVAPQFLRLPRNAKFGRLRQRCRADMFVSLKNVFGSEALDAILLREYASLENSLRETYRYVCALEAIGTSIHRQLVLRLLSLDSTLIKGTLELLEGLVDEYDIKPSEGLYGWETRHPVIAQIITKYKFADAEEHEALLQSVVEELNPSVFVELRTLRELCNSEFGVNRLPSDEARLAIYQKMIEVAPAERIPRHRMIRTLLHMNDLEGAEEALRDAEENVSLDPPLARYKVRLLIRRSEQTPGILEEDRVAMLRQAAQTAAENVRRFPNDMHAHIMVAEVAANLATRLGNREILETAINGLEEAAEKLLDPALSEAIDEYRVRMRRMETPARPSLAG